MKWPNASMERPCPVCGRPNAEHTSRYCKIAPEGNAAVCGFVAEGAKRSAGQAGWLHVGLSQSIAPRTAAARPASRKVETAMPVSVDWETMQTEYARRAGRRSEELAMQLGVPASALRSVGLGLRDASEWTFPMRDGHGKIIGIRIRTEGEKYAVKGSRNGCFVPNDLFGEGPLCFVEGPTDTAALVSVGMDVVGFASALSGLAHCVGYAVGRDCVVIRDGDEVGRLGAERLAALLRKAASSVSIISPGEHKDARDWVRAGATKAEIMDAIERANAKEK